MEAACVPVANDTPLVLPGPESGVRTNVSSLGIRYLSTQSSDAASLDGARSPSKPSKCVDLIVYLPGAAGRAEHFWLQLSGRRAFIEKCFSDRPEVREVHQLSFDYPGSGAPESVNSIWKKSCFLFSMDSLASQIWDAVAEHIEDKLGVKDASTDERRHVAIHLVGLSFGGMLAQRMVIQFQNQQIPAYLVPNEQDRFRVSLSTVILANTYSGLWNFYKRPCPQHEMQTDDVVDDNLCIGRSTWGFPFYLPGVIWLVGCALTLCFDYTMRSALSDLNEAWLRFGPPRVLHFLRGRPADDSVDGKAREGRHCEVGRLQMLEVLAASKNIDMESISRGCSGHASFWTFTALIKLWISRRVGDVSFLLAMLRHGATQLELAASNTSDAVPKSSDRPYVKLMSSDRDWLVEQGNMVILQDLFRSSGYQVEFTNFEHCGHFVQLDSTAFTEEMCKGLKRSVLQ